MFLEVKGVVGESVFSKWEGSVFSGCWYEGIIVNVNNSHKPPSKRTYDIKYNFEYGDSESAYQMVRSLSLKSYLLVFTIVANGQHLNFCTFHFLKNFGVSWDRLLGMKDQKNVRTPTKGNRSPSDRKAVERSVVSSSSKASSPPSSSSSNKLTSVKRSNLSFVSTGDSVGGSGSGSLHKSTSKQFIEKKIKRKTEDNADGSSPMKVMKKGGKGEGKGKEEERREKRAEIADYCPHW